MQVKKEKTLYLCSGCKKFGVRSYKAKVFETFSCPKCKKETTLFLPNPKKINKPNNLKLFLGDEEFEEVLPPQNVQSAQEEKCDDLDEAILEKEIFNSITEDLERDIETHPMVEKKQEKTSFLYGLMFFAGFVTALFVLKTR